MLHAGGSAEQRADVAEAIRARMTGVGPTLVRLRERSEIARLADGSVVL